MVGRIETRYDLFRRAGAGIPSGSRILGGPPVRLGCGWLIFFLFVQSVCYWCMALTWAVPQIVLPCVEIVTIIAAIIITMKIGLFAVRRAEEINSSISSDSVP